MKAKDIIRVIEKDGWNLVRQKGSHMHFQHPIKPGTVSVPYHGNKDIAKHVIANILKQAGLK
ncbi:MAG TPA: type II toxin-antitoxin system HicA family toxin [Acidobacteriaceae bacterium]|jgi:predicted RNA binding protein YcfA (HicA-like mRNA interferase family)|nr:type II toxin-antitoxin system HicA family toxin [Acidobacteriaceae bacterium]